MNDRFMFRYYSIEDKRYLKNSEIQAIFGLSCLEQKADDNTPIQAVNVCLGEGGKAKFFSEQCTGIEDRNGDLVFEGDVLRVFDMSGDVFKEGPVVFKGTAFGIAWEDGGNCPCLPVDTEDEFFQAEIIGNIHDGSNR